ncbi:4-amino-4-deoxy-L-arabinose transferase [Bacillus sp. FJAT-27264]|uniref:ArnT family glycosyltransferase n=1 Tax=Paenibacillus sp. (strain DSM 101736 / FJAT-27264) TaxID=1850362 RepID=UPI000807D651|nr:glycosyltransferase family 39 protein [Bacillus sp. FJAT-27264]OBZ10447.1 4-amino-4-deoxy-L-arabinose transferase [Bacillus sp. FJAT-27264]
MSTIKKQGPDLILPFILLLAAFLYGYGIWNDHYANTYYTTAVGSMLQSFHNFFFASLDSAGSVTVDKPPVTFWIQSLFALIFGLHGWSVILPQALAGVGSVLLVYLLVKPTYGRSAARIAALVMASTPVAAAVSRTNNIDAMLVFTLLLAVWFLFRGTQRNRIGSLLAAFALIGVGFNEKMLQAYMVLPAFYLFYLLAAKVGWKRKTGVLAASTAVMLVVSLSWAVVVDSIPADKRPFIGSSGTNSVLNLAFGYNGVSRLTGDRSTGAEFGGSGMPDMNGNEMPAWNGEATDGGNGNVSGMDGGNSNASGMDGGRSGQGKRLDGGSAGGQMNGGLQGFPPGNGMNSDGRQRDRGQGGQGGFGGGGGMFHTGTPGALRLFQSDLSGQASWLLPLVAVACIGLFASLRRRNFTQKHKEAIFWLAWLVPVMGFFSIAGFFHQYYLIMMAPPIAALAGAGWIQLWSQYRERSGWRSWLLPAAILATVALQGYILHPYDSTIGSGWSIGILAAGIAVTLLLVIFKGKEQSFVHVTAVAGLLVLLIGPLYWAITPIAYGSNSMTPAAGPDSNSGPGGGLRMNTGFNASGDDPNVLGGRGANFGGGTGGFGGGAGNSDGNAGNLGGGADNSAGGFGGGTGNFGGGAGNFAGGRGGFGGRGSEGVNEALLTYLEEHNSGEQYLFAAMDYGTAGPYIIDNNASVVILNGFNASDQVYTPDSLKALVESGKVKYFLISGGGMGGGRGGNSELTTWITENGTEVPTADWQGAGATANSGTLYEVTLK